MPPKPKNTRPTIDARSQQAEKRADAANVPPIPEGAPDPEAPEGRSPEDLLRDIEVLHTRYTHAMSTADRERKKLVEQAAAIERSKQEHADRVAALVDREKNLLARERAIAAAELDAETGFAQKEREYLERAHAELGALRDELRDAALQVETGELAGMQERIAAVQALRGELEQAYLARESDLVMREAKLDEARGGLELSERKIAAATRQLEWDREGLESEVSAALAAERARFEADRVVWAAERTVLESTTADLAERKADLDDRERRSRYVDPVQLEAEKDELVGRLRAAHEDLANRPPIEEVDELRHRVHLLDEQVAELDEQRARTYQLEAQLEANRSELERHRLVEMRNENLQAEKGALAADVDKLRRTLSELSDRVQGERPFPQCSSFDEDQEIQARPELWEYDGKLPDLVELIKRIIAADGLYYDDATLRSFLAGMHMSRLHILQGISGTGKSSLPQAIAKVFGIECVTVEVQAAWRDRQDLLGYYNPFEHRYEETPFLTALYLAGTPKHASSPMFVLLDEMNLSHPEQYLADVISAMERPRPEQMLRLMNHPGQMTPAQMADGMTLRLPPNLWILGTANHDETTMSFAPKTYDRSHVMELPVQHPAPFAGKARPDPAPISLASIERLLVKAVDIDEESSADQARQFLGGLRPTLAKLGIGWGNRIDKQLAAYAPVVTAAGGSVREAVDRFVSLKVLKKLEGRYEITTDEVDHLREDVQLLWSALPQGQAEPTAMIEVLDKKAKALA